MSVRRDRRTQALRQGGGTGGRPQHGAVPHSLPPPLAACVPRLGRVGSLLLRRQLLRGAAGEGPGAARPLFCFPCGVRGSAPRGFPALQSGFVFGTGMGSQQLSLAAE